MTGELFRAVTAGDLQAAKLIIEKGCDINSQDPDYGMTALHKAVELDNAEIVKLLLEHGADISIECLRGRTPLGHLDVYSARDSDPQTLEIVKMIVNQNVPLETSSYHNVLRLGSKKMVRIVLQSNIDLFRRDEIGQTPIHYLAGNTNDAVIEELHGKKFNVNAPDKCGVSPLLKAAQSGLPSSVEFLLNNGADRDVIQETFTVIFTLARYIKSDDMPNYQHVIELLVEYGADPRINDLDYIIRSRLRDRFGRILESVLILHEPLIAYLSLVEKRGEAIHEYEDFIIDRFPTTNEFFKICRQQLTTLETTKINDSLNLYQLLISNDAKVEYYARDSDIVSKIRSICVNEQSYRPYGFKIRKRLERAIEMVNLKKKAAFAFCNLNSLDYNACCLFVDQIMGYLNRIDLQRLYEV